MKLSKQDLSARKAALLCPEGEQEACVKEITFKLKDSGEWLFLVYVTDEHEVAESFLLTTSRQDLESLNVDHLQRLLQAIEATLGIDEVEDLGPTLEDMRNQPVMITVKHRKGSEGKTVAGVTAWRRKQ